MCLNLTASDGEICFPAFSQSASGPSAGGRLGLCLTDEVLAGLTAVMGQLEFDKV